mmetsp:Transcript_108806/g.307779  ORF Transcript_108806/g.307779 Transcript_108806/m.307779 type:complete len:287 (+) Transcript_108806:485-1345(+)
MDERPLDEKVQEGLAAGLDAVVAPHLLAGADPRRGGGLVVLRVDLHPGVQGEAGLHQRAPPVRGRHEAQLRDPLPEPGVGLSQEPRALLVGLVLAVAVNLRPALREETVHLLPRAGDRRAQGPLVQLRPRCTLREPDPVLVVGAIGHVVGNVRQWESHDRDAAADIVRRFRASRDAVLVQHLPELAPYVGRNRAPVQRLQEPLVEAPELLDGGVPHAGHEHRRHRHAQGDPVRDLPVDFDNNVARLVHGPCRVQVPREPKGLGEAGGHRDAARGRLQEGVGPPTAA